MYQREAMWIHFRTSKRYAVKVSVGDVNAITGDSRFETRQDGKQDYVVVGQAGGDQL